MITSASSCALPTRRPVTSATCWRKRPKHSSSRATARSNWRYLPGSNEVIWFSERDNWGQLYLHDLKTGREKQPITQRRRQRHAVAAASTRRTGCCISSAVGKENGRDPYFRHFYRIGIDGRINSC